MIERIKAEELTSSRQERLTVPKAAAELELNPEQFASLWELLEGRRKNVQMVPVPKYLFTLLLRDHAKLHAVAGAAGLRVVDGESP